MHGQTGWQRSRAPKNPHDRLSSEPYFKDCFEQQTEMMPAIPARPYDFELPASPHQIALMVIDMQRDFLEPGGFGEALGNDVAPLAAIVPTVQKLLQTARDRHLCIIHTLEGHQSDLSDCPPSKLRRSHSPRSKSKVENQTSSAAALRLGENLRVAPPQTLAPLSEMNSQSSDDCMKSSSEEEACHPRLGGQSKLAIGDRGPMGRILVLGEPGNAIVPALAPLPGEIVLPKPGKGAFCRTNLEAILQDKGITHLLFAGVTTEVCVQTTLREASDRGFDCLLVEDATASYFPHFKQATLEMVRAQGAIVGWTATCEAVVAALANWLD